ncbi:tetrapyrrole methylase [Desulfocarbo indianensis]|nr:tetrapyrrole methylase [Desulfocarbo indianensis]
MNRKPGISIRRVGLALALLASLLMTAPALAADAQAGQPQGGYSLVGLGPGDADLMTPRQVKAIQEADIVFCRPKTKEKLAPLVDFKGKKVVEGYNLIFPYYGKKCSEVPADLKKRWGKTCEEYHQKQAEFARMVREAVAQGKKVVMTISGDPTIYSPGIWSVLALKDLKPKVVPGLSAFNAGNAALKASLGDVVITAPFSKKEGKDSLESLAGHERATVVVFMPRDFKKLMPRLQKAYAGDTPMAVVSNAGHAGQEKVLMGTVADMGAKLAKTDAGPSLVYVGKALSRAQFKPDGQGQATAGKGKFYLVGVGPGDSDLATLRALEVIKKADLIFAHKRIQELFPEQLKGKKVVDGYYRLFPFYGRDCSKISESEKSRERMSCEEYHRKQAEFAAMVRQAVAQGQTVAMLDSGDPLVYGPCSWSIIELNDVPNEVVPGLSCFNAANAAIGLGVTEGKKSHSVLLASGWSVEEMAPHQATMILFTMRTEFKKFTDSLLKYYPPETPVAIVFNAGYSQSEKVLHGTLGDITEKVGGKKLPFQHLLYVGDFLTNEKPY